MLHEVDLIPLKELVDYCLLPDCKVFAFCEDDDREELKLMILEAV